MAALAGDVAAVERGQNAHRGPHAGALVDDRHADAHRLAAVDAGHAHDAAMRLHQRVVARPLAQRPGAAIGAEIAIDQRGLFGAQRRRAEAELVDRAGPHVLDHDVGVLEDERFQPLDRDVVAQVEREPALVVIEHVEQRRGAVRERRPPVARVVALAGAFDLDDVGAEIGEDRGCVRAGDAVAELDDGGPGQRIRPFLVVLGRSMRNARAFSGKVETGTAARNGWQV